MKIARLYLPIKKILRRLGYDVVIYRPVFEKALARYEIDTVLDIGANTGQFSLEIYKLLPEAKIYSFEPLHDIFSELKKNTATIPKFKAFNVGLGATNGNIEIERSSFSPSSSFLHMSSLHKTVYPKSAETFKETVTLKRLDDVTNETESKIDLSGNLLIKMDVQGFESEVIKGGMETLKKAKVLLLETSFVELYTGQMLFDDIYKLIRSLGFKYIGRHGQHWNDKTNEVMYEDSIFVKI